MIHEADKAIQSFIERELAGAGAEVLFEAPTKEWAARRNTPTVDIYLYDIREDTHRRHVGEIQNRNEDGVVVSRGTPSRYFRLSYLVTAWTQRPEDEHRLLAAMLSAFLRHKVVPPEDLIGSLSDQNLPVLLEVAKPPPENRQISEVWTALGGELKASLDLMITAPMSREPVLVTAPPASGGTVVQTFGEEGQESEAHARPKPAEPAEPAEASTAPSGGRS